MTWFIRWPKARWLATATALIVSLAGIWVAFVWLSMPTAIAIGLSLLLAAGLFWMDRFAPLITAISLLMVLASAEVILSFLDHQPAYYRPHEMLSDGLAHYKINQQLVDFPIPYGDLYNISRRTEPTIKTPRKVSFKTDGWGFRNDHDYSGEKIIVIGDSFVAGTGLDQPDTLANQLAPLIDGGVYAIGYPSGPYGYTKNYTRLKDKLAPDHQVIWMIFEGNDFECFGKEGRKTKSVPRYLDKPNWVKNSAVYRHAFGLSRNAFNKLLRFGPEDAVLIKSVGDQDFGFWRLYETITRREENCGWAAVSPILEAAKAPAPLVVFIPTKYRVFYPFVARRGDPDLPNIQKQNLQQGALDAGFSFLDLTPVLIKAQSEAMQQGGFVFWPDDTHWSPLGVRASAKAIAESLNKITP